MKIKFYNLFLQESIHEVEKIYNSKKFIDIFKKDINVSAYYEMLEVQKILQKMLIKRMKEEPDKKQEFQLSYEKSVNKVKNEIIPNINREKKDFIEYIKNMIEPLQYMYKEISERWILQQYINGFDIGLIKVSDIIDFYNLSHKFNKNDSRNILSYNVEELSYIVARYKDVDFISSIINNKELDKYIIHKDDRYIAYENKSFEVNSKLCHGTKWCVNSRKNFENDYKSNLILIIDTEKLRRYLLYLDKFELRDESNKSQINANDLRHLIYNVIIKLTDKVLVKENEVEFKSEDDKSKTVFKFEPNNDNILHIERFNHYDKKKSESVFETYLGDELYSINDQPGYFLIEEDFDYLYNIDITRRIYGYYNENGKLHRDNGPAEISIKKDAENGLTLEYHHSYYNNGIIHKSDNNKKTSKPCSVYYQISLKYTKYAVVEEWYYKGKMVYNKQSEKEKIEL